MAAKPNIVRLGLVQMRCSAEPRENLAKALDLAGQAAERGAQIICLQELFTSQYFCQVEDHKYFQLAEEIPGPSTEVFSKFARERGVVVVASLFEKRSAGLYHNTAAVIDADGAYLGKYRKMHIPDDPLFYEKFYFTPGDLGFRAWQTRFGKIGVCVCWDQWYPEAARLTALARARRFFFTRRRSAGTRREKKEYRKARQHSIRGRRSSAAHAIANGCFVAAVNRIGWDTKRRTAGAGLDFWGQSFVADPAGQILKKASARDAEENPDRRGGSRRGGQRSARTGHSCAIAGLTLTSDNHETLSSTDMPRVENDNRNSRDSRSALGYRMPAEWEPHAATWLSWPRRDGISFPGKDAYDKAVPAIAKMVHALADFGKSR